MNSVRFHWLNYPKQYINNWKTFKDDVEKNLDILNDMKNTKDIFTKKMYSNSFSSEKIFLINMINQGIVCKNLGFNVKLEKKESQ